MKINLFAKRLLELMIEKEWTQTQLAYKLRTTQQTISRYLNGIHEPDFDTVLKLCGIFEADPNYLFGWDNKKVLIEALTFAENNSIGNDIELENLEERQRKADIKDLKKKLKDLEAKKKP